MLFFSLIFILIFFILFPGITDIGNREPLFGLLTKISHDPVLTEASIAFPFFSALRYRLPPPLPIVKSRNSPPIRASITISALNRKVPIATMIHQKNQPIATIHEP